MLGQDVLSIVRFSVEKTRSNKPHAGSAEFSNGLACKWYYFLDGTFWLKCQGASGEFMRHPSKEELMLIVGRLKT